MSQAVPNGTCKSCAWWIIWRNQPTKIDAGRTLGECRKRAPRMFIRESMNGEASPQTRWPATQDADFCGDFRQREAHPEVGS